MQFHRCHEPKTIGGDFLGLSSDLIRHIGSYQTPTSQNVAKLFAGNFEILLEIPIGEEMSSSQIGAVRQGHAFFFVWGHLDDLDGFERCGQTEFALFYKSEGCVWIPYDPEMLADMLHEAPQMVFSCGEVSADQSSRIIYN